MNDEGKTVISIRNVEAGYRRRMKRGRNPERRFIEIKMQFDLHPDFPGEHGYEATMHAISVVKDRVVNACANEFLPP